MATVIAYVDGFNLHHGQYLAGSKNPNGCCPVHGIGVSCQIGVVRADG